MKYLLCILVGMTVIFSSCKSSDLARTTEEILVATGEDREKAKRIGDSAGQIASGLGEMPYENERALGEGIALGSLATRGRLYDNPGMQNYVNLVGKSVATAVPRNIPYTFAVVESETINAWAAPGGFVFITTGALSAMEDEAQLAGVLAHELAHVNEGHMLRTIKRGMVLEGAFDILQASKDDVEKYGNAVDLGQSTLFDKGFDRSMELDADLIGMEYATLAGYDPGGLLRYMKNVSSRQSSGGGWLSSTHPRAKARIDKMEVFLNTDLVGLEGATAADRFRSRVLEPLLSAQ